MLVEDGERSGEQESQVGFGDDRVHEDNLPAPAPRGLRQAHPLEQAPESRIAAQAVNGRLDLEVAQPAPPLLVARSSQSKAGSVSPRPACTMTKATGET